MNIRILRKYCTASGLVLTPGVRTSLPDDEATQAIANGIAAEISKAEPIVIAEPEVDDEPEVEAEPEPFVDPEPEENPEDT